MPLDSLAGEEGASCPTPVLVPWASMLLPLVLGILVLLYTVFTIQTMNFLFFWQCMV